MIHHIGQSDSRAYPHKSLLIRAFFAEVVASRSGLVDSVFVYLDGQTVGQPFKNQRGQLVDRDLWHQPVRDSSKALPKQDSTGWLACSLRSPLAWRSPSPDSSNPLPAVESQQPLKPEVN